MYGIANLLQGLPEGVRGVAVIVDDQHPLAAAGAHLRGSGRRVLLLWTRRAARRGEGQPDGELAPPAWAVARGRDHAAMELDEALGHGQSNAEPARRAVERAVGLDEELEDLRQDLR